MKLVKDVYMVGSGQFGLSDALDCHAYLLDGGGECALLDAGAGREPQRLIENLRADGWVEGPIAWILLTHAHADHAGGGAAWRRALPSIRIAASAETAPWLAAADEEATSVDRARAAGLYPADYRLEPFEVDRTLTPGETLRIADLDFQAIPSPGHAAGHLAFLVEVDQAATLFSGDALFPAGRILLQDTWDCDLHEALRSVERLAGLGADRLLAGHLEPVVSSAAAHFAAAIERIARLSVPASIA